MALRACDPPTCKAAVRGMIAIVDNVAALTTNPAVPDLPPKLTVINDEPLATPVATPVVCTTVPTATVPELQLEKFVTSRVIPSL